MTSAANERSWSTITLIVSLSSWTSPRTSTVIFCERSPLATAVVTSAMLRTWLVRLPARVLTLSVRSFQTPETPSTCAWPPSFPSVPTSRATRVTSAANEEQLVDHHVDRVLELEDLALDVDGDLLGQVAVSDRGGDGAMLRTWPVRLPARVLTLSVRSFQTPETPLTCAWPPELAFGADLAWRRA